MKGGGADSMAVFNFRNASGGRAGGGIKLNGIIRDYRMENPGDLSNQKRLSVITSRHAIILWGISLPRRKADSPPLRDEIV